MTRNQNHPEATGDGQVALALQERRAVVRELSSRYRRASKKDKGKILEQLVALTGYNRSYAARALRQVGRPRGTIGPPARRGGGRRRMYDDIVPTLTKVWAILDCPSGKRLAPFLPEVVPRLELFGEIQLTADQRQKLTSISASTIDRLLAPEKKRMRLKGRSGTKPGAFLKHEVPIKTFADWSDTQPGFLEVDLVSHDGSSARGDYAQTLDAVDVATGWTETVAVKNKAQKWVFAALQRIIAAMPFPVKGIDSDNGAEFINNQLIRFCAQNKITFTRSRPYRKNDSCHVEQKNWSVVRRTVGYFRYSSEAQVAILNELYQVLRLYTNYFQPNLKLIHKERHGAKVKRTYDEARTPYQRILLCPHVTEEIKAALAEQYAGLNPAELKRQIIRFQDALFDSVISAPDLVTAQRG